MNAKHVSLFNRLFFTLALILVVVAAIDWVMRLFGYTFSWLDFTPGRLFEFAGIMMIFVVVALLRQIRDLLRKE